MKIKTGYSRIVFVFSHFVVKIPKMHIRYPFRYLFMKKTARKNILELKSLKDVLKYIFHGVYANRLEYRYSKLRVDSTVIMHSQGLFFGLIVIQKRGVALMSDDKRWLKFLRIVKRLGCKEIDSIRSCNFCIWNGTIRLLDYGKQETIEGLERINSDLLERFNALSVTKE